MDTLTGSILAKQKNLFFVVYASAARRSPSSVTSRLRISVQSAKLASPIELSEQQQKINVFSANKIFTTCRAPFPNTKFLISRSWLYLRSLCSVHCLREPKEALRFPYFGSRKHTFSNPCWLCITLHVCFSLLRCAQRSLKRNCFSQNL